MVRLINNSEEGRACDCTVFSQPISLDFVKFEVKTLLYRNGQLTEQRSMLDL